MTERWLHVDKERGGRRAEGMLVYSELSKCLIMLLLPLVRMSLLGILGIWKERLKRLEVAGMTLMILDFAQNKEKTEKEGRNHTR